MTTNIPSGRMAAVALASFSVLIALRDVSFELFLKEEPVAFAFVVCATIALLSAIIVSCKKDGWKSLANKVRKKEVLGRVALLGLLSAGIYGAGFYLVSIMGAGTFHTINYGLLPVVVAVVGAMAFSTTIPATFWLAFGTYLTGLALLMTETKNLDGFAYAGLAMLVPIVTALCDALTKWLLNPKRPAALAWPEVLVVRFVPASIALFIYAVPVSGKSIVINDVVPALTVAVFCGFVPLGLLCFGLVQSTMQKYAAWLFLIPAIAFFGTLHKHPESARPLPIAGALLIMAGVVVCKTPLGERLVRMMRKSPGGLEQHSATSAANPK